MFKSGYLGSGESDIWERTRMPLVVGLGVGLKDSWGPRRKGNRTRAARTIIPSVAGSETKDCVQAAQMLSKLT